MNYDNTYLLYNYLNLGIIVTDINNNIIYVNTYTSSFITKNNLEIDFIIKNLINNDDNKLPIIIELQISNIWIKIYKYFIIDINKFIIIFNDISSHKQLELDYYKQINDKSNLQSIFLSNMNKEIKTPLNGIISMITLLEQTKLNSEQENYINLLRESTIHLLTIINDIFDYTKLESNMIVLKTEYTNFYDFINNISIIINNKLKDTDIQYIVNLPTNINEYIYIDNIRLKQVLLNLLNNSIKFTKKGSITLDINFDNNYLYFKIIDTGIGIKESDIPFLFLPFTHDFNESSGLGLLISKKLIKLMGGSIWLEKSIPNKETIFIFNIKLININKINDKSYNILITNNNQLQINIINNLIYYGIITYCFNNLENTNNIINTININYCILDNTNISFKDQITFVKKIITLHKNIKCILINNNNNTKDEINELIKYFNILNYPLNYNKLIEYINNNDTILTKSVSNKDKKILIVEDVKINCIIIENFLKILNYDNYFSVNDGLECLIELTINIYDIILLNIKISNNHNSNSLDGISILKYILNFYNTKNISNNIQNKYKLLNKQKPYIIALTNSSNIDDKNHLLSLGFDDYILKPIFLDNLNAILKKIN